MSAEGRLRAAVPFVALAATFALVTTLGPLADDRISDLFVYRGYAQGVLGGAHPYADLGFEYPPLALGPLLVPGLGDAPAGVYEWRFGVLMLAAALAVQALVGALGGRRAAWLCVLLPLLTGALLRTRFDLVPVALLLAGLLVARRRPTAGLAVLALATATKLFPVLAAALLLVHLEATGRRRAAVRGAVAFVAVLAAVCLPFAGDGFVDQFRFHLDRPVQIESTPATVLWLLGDSSVTGDPVRPDRFKSNGLDGGPAETVALGFAVALGLVLVAVGVVLRSARDGSHALQRAVLCALLAFVALGKVLSPQYLVWLLPLAALAWVRGDRTVAVLVVAAAAATLVYFPGSYFDLVAGADAQIATVAVRNLLLLGALAAGLAALRRNRERDRLAPRRSP